MADLIITDPKKLVKQLKKVETELKLITSKMKPEDRQNGNGSAKTCREVRRNKKRGIVEARHNLKDAIPRKTPKTAKNQYKMCE